MIDPVELVLFCGAVFCSYKWGRAAEREWWHDRFRLAGGSLTLNQKTEEKQ